MMEEITSSLIQVIARRLDSPKLHIINFLLYGDYVCMYVCMHIHMYVCTYVLYIFAAGYPALSPSQKQQTLP